MFNPFRAKALDSNLPALDLVRPSIDSALSYARRYFNRMTTDSNTPPAIIYACLESDQCPLAREVLFILPADSTTGATEYRGRFTIWQEEAAPGITRLYGEW